jgi:hypothetical protein
MTMKPARKLLALLGAAVLSASLAACGGGSSSGLSRSQIVSRANSLCAAGVAASSKIPPPTSFQNPVVVAAYFNKIEPITASETTKLEALKPASSVKSQWDAYLAARKSGLQLLQTLQHKANAKDPSGLADLRQVPAMQQRIISAARALGANECAK